MKTEKERLKMIKEASKHYKKFMLTLGMNPDTNDHERDTPMRVAKSFVNDLVVGLYNDAPKITAFENTDGYDGMVFQGNIDLKSICQHHHLPFVGKAHVAYIPSTDGKVVGLSKLNRIVEHFARKPQVQENLTMQIHDFINETCVGNKGVAVMISSNHMCACLRGVKHDSTMMTSKLSGGFLNEDRVREEFYNFIKNLK
jgi:GTP cyclohydrolase I